MSKFTTLKINSKIKSPLSSHQNGIDSKGQKYNFLPNVILKKHYIFNL